MDLIDVLIEATVDSRDEAQPVRLGHRALDAYYTDLFGQALPEQSGQTLVRVALNFGVQQLATRSRVARETWQFLQIGSLNVSDFAAGLINTMPHTMVHWVPGFTSVTAADCAEVVDMCTANLPLDAMPTQCQITSQGWPERLATLPDGSLGLVAVMCDRIAPELADCVAQARAKLNPAGRVVVFEALLGARRPTLFAGPDFSGRYIMTGQGPVRTLAITALSGESVDD